MEKIPLFHSIFCRSLLKLIGAVTKRNFFSPEFLVYTGTQKRKSNENNELYSQVFSTVNTHTQKFEVHQD